MSETLLEHAAHIVERSNGDASAAAAEILDIASQEAAAVVRRFRCSYWDGGARRDLADEVLIALSVKTTRECGCKDAYGNRPRADCPFCEGTNVFPPPKQDERVDEAIQYIIDRCPGWRPTPAMRGFARAVVEAMRGDICQICKQGKLRDAHGTGMRVCDHCRAVVTATAVAIDAATVERCAQVCEQQARDFLSPQYAADQPSSSFAERFAAGKCAQEIRNLLNRETAHG